MGQNEATLSTHPARSETKKVTDKEPTRPVRNTRTWMKTTSYGKTKQHLFVGLLLGVIVLSTQAQALSIEQAGPPICCQAYNAKCLSCAEGISEEQFCRKNPRNFLGTPGCEKYTTPPDNNCCQAYNAKCESCKQGISEEEFCKKNPSDFFGGVQGCEKYHKGDGGKGCCKANTADCLACSEGKSVEKFCKKKKNRDVPGCEKYHRRGSWGKNDRDDSRQQGDGG